MKLKKSLFFLPNQCYCLSGLFKALIFDLYPAGLSVPLFASLIIMSSFHVFIHKFDLMLHMLPGAHKNRGLQSTMQVLVHFCGTGNFFL